MIDLKSPESMMRILKKSHYAQGEIKEVISCLHLDQKSDYKIYYLISLAEFNDVFCGEVINFLHSPDMILHVLLKVDVLNLYYQGIKLLGIEQIIELLEEKKYRKVFCEMAMPFLSEEVVYCIVCNSSFSLDVSLTALRFLKSEYYILRILEENPDNVCIRDAVIRALQKGD